MIASQLILGGSIPALITPFNRDSADLDETVLAILAERAVRRGSTALVVCGSTGEAPALRPDEHARAVQAVVEAVGKHVPVIAGVGAPCTEVAVQLAHAAEQCGASALLCSAPPYVKPGQDGLFAHVQAVAAVSGLPVILYDVPSRAGVAFADETIARLRDANLVHALKDATADLSRPPRLKLLCGADYTQLSGDDATALAHLIMGGAGCISVMANITPALCAALQDAWIERKVDQAAELRDQLAPLADALFCETNPVPCKAALGLLRLCDSTPRLPLTRASEATRVRLANVLVDLSKAEENTACVMAGVAASRWRAA